MYGDTALTAYGDTAMTDPARQAGRVTLPGAALSLARLGYGAIQLAGPGVVSPPRDPDAAGAVLREAVALGITHIDTSDDDGPHVTNRIIRRALHPYPDDLVIVTKVGARRPADGSWVPALARRELTAAVHDNLRHLGLDALDVVDLHMMGDDGHRRAEGSLAGPLTALGALTYTCLETQVVMLKKSAMTSAATRFGVDRPMMRGAFLGPGMMWPPPWTVYSVTGSCPTCR